MIWLMKFTDQKTGLKKSLAELELFLRGGKNLAIALPSLSKIHEFFEK